MKREYILRVVCQKPGCHETSFYKYDTKSDYVDGYKRNNGKWMCLRHSNEDKVLTPHNLEAHIHKELTCVPLANIGNQHFWDGKNGFAHGDCFRAWAKDFPPGTKLIVESTARIILPENPDNAELP